MERFNWCHSSQNMLNHDASIEQSVDKDPSQQLAGDEPLREKNDEHQSKCLLEETIQIDDEHQSDDGNPGVNAENQSGRLNVQDDGDLNNRHEALTGKIQFGPVLRNATITYQPKSAMSLFLNSTDQHTRVPGEDLRRAARTVEVYLIRICVQLNSSPRARCWMNNIYQRVTGRTAPVLPSSRCF